MELKTSFPNLHPLIIARPTIQRRILISIVNTLNITCLNYVDNTQMADRYLKSITKNIIFLDEFSAPMPPMLFVRYIRHTQRYRSNQALVFMCMQNEPGPEIYRAMEAKLIDGFIMQPFHMKNVMELLSKLCPTEREAPQARSIP